MYIDAALFFARVQPGQRFRFRRRPGCGSDADEALVLACTGRAERARVDGELFVPFAYPPETGRGDGAFWWSASDVLEFEILPEVAS